MPLRSLTVSTLLFLLMVLMSIGCDWSSPEAKKAAHRERAASYFDKRQYQEAVIEYANVVKIDPKDADAQYRLGLSYLKIGGLPNLQQAYAALTRAVELDNWVKVGTRSFHHEWLAEGVGLACREF